MNLGTSRSHIRAPGRQNPVSEVERVEAAAELDNFPPSAREQDGGHFQAHRLPWTFRKDAQHLGEIWLAGGASLHLLICISSSRFSRSLSQPTSNDFTSKEKKL